MVCIPAGGGLVDSGLGHGHAVDGRTLSRGGAGSNLSSANRLCRQYRRKLRLRLKADAKTNDRPYYTNEGKCNKSNFILPK